MEREREGVKDSCCCEESSCQSQACLGAWATNEGFLFLEFLNDHGTRTKIKTCTWICLQTHTHTCFRQITRPVGSVSVYHFASYVVASMCVCLCMYLISCNLHSIQAAKSLQLFMDKSSDWMITMRTHICSLTHIINGSFVVLLTVETVNCSK